MPRYLRAWLLCGGLSAALLLVVLAVLAVLRGVAFWMPMNATTQLFHGPAVAEVARLDFAHTGLGTLINISACFFWAAVAVFLAARARAGWPRTAWIIGLGTALLAGIVDYLLIPVRLRPGWELVLPPLSVAVGLVAMGVGLALGLIAESKMAGREATANLRPGSARHPAPPVVDRQRDTIDTAAAPPPDQTDPGTNQDPARKTGHKDIAHR